MKSYEEAKKIVKLHNGLDGFVGNISDVNIGKAEEELGVSFPKSYKQFLRDFGAGNFGAEEIYGVLNGDFDNSGIPDAIWFTKKQRREMALASNLVIIYFTGGSDYFCLDVNQMNDEGECPVVACAVGFATMGEKLEIIAENFSDFFLELVKREVS